MTLEEYHDECEAEAERLDLEFTSIRLSHWKNPIWLAGFVINYQAEREMQLTEVIELLNAETLRCVSAYVWRLTTTEPQPLDMLKGCDVVTVKQMLSANFTLREFNEYVHVWVNDDFDVIRICFRLGKGDM